MPTATQNYQKISLTNNLFVKTAKKNSTKKHSAFSAQSKEAIFLK